MLDEVVVLVVPDPPNTGHVDVEFPGGLLYEINEFDKLVAAHHEVLSDTSETLAQYLSNEI